MAVFYDGNGNKITVSGGGGSTSITTDDIPASISTFKKIGVVGDSFASGTVNVNDKQPSYVALSWPQHIARLSGVTVSNFTAAGLSTRTWLTNANGLSKLLATEAQGLYILALGINDDNLGASYIGTIADIKVDYTENADTFFGNYGKIIAQIKAHAPAAKLVMTTLARVEPLKAQLDAAIAEIAGHFGIPYTVLDDNSFFTTGNFPMSSGHPSVVDYGGMAKAIIRSVETCMVDNADYFEDYADTSGEGGAHGGVSLETVLQTQKIRTIAFGIAKGELGKVETGYNLKTPDYDHKSTTAPGVSSAGLPATSDGSAIGGAISQSDICVVGDEVWFFGAASDDNLTYGTCWRLKYDPVSNEMLDDPKFFWHNWGHVNSINYNPDNDCLIMGNGGASYTLGNKIYIIPNASKIKDMPNGAVVSLADYGMEIDVSGQTEFGVKLNVFWTNTTGLVYKYAGDKMASNMAYAYSDDGNKFHILVFGFDTYQYPLGTYVAPTEGNRFNGTYNILKTYQIGNADETIGNPGSYTHCGQGGSALAGAAYIGRGHSSLWISEIIPNGNDFTEIVKNITNYNWQTGAAANNKVLGLDVTSNYLILARTGQSSNSMICFIPR